MFSDHVCCLSLFKDRDYARCLIYTYRMLKINCMALSVSGCFSTFLLLLLLPCMWVCVSVSVTGLHNTPHMHTQCQPPAGLQSYTHRLSIHIIPVCTCTCVMRAYIHTHLCTSHTYMYHNTHTHTCTSHIHTYLHITHTHIHTHLLITHTHTCTSHAHTHTCTSHTYTHLLITTCTHTHTPAYHNTHTYTHTCSSHTYMYTHIHTPAHHTHTHIHTVIHCNI